MNKFRVKITDKIKEDSEQEKYLLILKNKIIAITEITDSEIYEAYELDVYWEISRYKKLKIEISSNIELDVHFVPYDHLGKMILNYDKIDSLVCDLVEYIKE